MSPPSPSASSNKFVGMHASTLAISWMSHRHPRGGRIREKIPSLLVREPFAANLLGQLLDELCP
jgi:hypothetical protein